MIPSAVPGDHHTTTAEPTPCPVELCEETVDYTGLIPHLYSDHDGQELCEAIANLVADLAQEERACAERGRYLAEVDAALIAAGQDEAGGYIAYPRRIQQLAAERDKLRAELADQEEQAKTYHGRWQKVWQRARAVETVRCWTNEDGKRFLFADDVREALGWPVHVGPMPEDPMLLDRCTSCGHHREQHQANDALGGEQCKACPGDDERFWRHAFTLAAPAACTCGAALVHQHGCPAGQ